jgi:predicted dehydrogenase
VTPLRVIVVGVGLMGRQWLDAVAGSDEAELAGIADLDVAAARAVAGPELPVGPDAVRLARETGAQALINVTTPAAHHAVTTAALFAGLPVLGEKPLAETVAQGLSLAAASEVTGQLFMVSQSRRWNAQLEALRELTAGLGRIGTVTTEFFRSPRFGGFRDEMAYPLLTDMAIHAFDAVRHLLGDDPVAVTCRSWNPSWSWYAGDADANVIFEMRGGARYVYTGSWCSPGPESSWNGSWTVHGEKGSATWDGDTPPPGAEMPADDRPEGIAAALHAFVAALRTGVPPSGEVHDNLISLAMVEAAIASAEAGRTIAFDDVFAAARATALRDETHPEVRSRLAS